MKRIPFFVLSILLLQICSQTIAQTKKTTSATKPVLAKKITPIKKTVALKPAPVVKDNLIRIKLVTDSGVMILKLYDSTPLHRDNFVKLVKEGFFDSLLFHRVISQFMIQGGDPNSKYADSASMLGNGGGNLSRIPAEFKPSLYHKKGVLAAARDGNPEKASSACQFYIVEGMVYTDEQLNMIEQQKGIKYTLQQRTQYKTVGGTPQLDQEYTVFGEVEKGIDVIKKISNVKKNNFDRPFGNIRMKMELLK
jgi:peptidyl-prolyl cis-trans isomerase B (cyclophilin B)